MAPGKPESTAYPVKDEFHDVIFNVDKVLRGSVVHEGHQVITAREVIKLDIAGVDEMLEILQEYKRSYREGAGPLLCTFVGKFSR